MEPISLAIMSGAVGGATSTFLQRALDSGGKWFNDYLKDHQPQAIERANANVIAFLELLKRKIERLEADAAGAEERLNRIRKAMDEPDFAFSFKVALLQAARTSDGNKHTILARLVTERLSSGRDSLHSIVVQQACESMDLLTSNHLRILALCTWIRSLDASHRWGVYTGASVSAIYPIIRKLAPVSQIGGVDFIHLSSVSCLQISGDITASVGALNVLCAPNEEWGWKQRDAMVYLERLLYDGFNQPVLLTSKGLAIGACAGDVLTGSSTNLKTVLE
jgi:hypothetical protein